MTPGSLLPREERVREDVRERREGERVLDGERERRVLWVEVGGIYVVPYEG